MSKGEEESWAPAAFPLRSPVVSSLCLCPQSWGVISPPLPVPGGLPGSPSHRAPTQGQGQYSEAQVKGLWPQVVSWAREGHAEDGYPLPLSDWREQLQLAVHLHYGLPGS